MSHSRSEKNLQCSRERLEGITRPYRRLTFDKMFTKHGFGGWQRGIAESCVFGKKRCGNEEFSTFLSFS